MIGNMAALMAATTINVAVPAISQTFALGQHDAQWLATSFMGAMTVSMLCTPWLLERLGYRSCYQWLMLLLGLGGVIGGLSNHIAQVLSMRMVEGLAAGVLQTIPGVIIMRTFAKHEQGRAMGIFGFGTVLAPAIGPSVGGLLVEAFGWRAIFFFVLPFCLLGSLMARRILPDTTPEGLPANPQAQAPDRWSLLLLSAVLAVLLNGLVLLQGARTSLGISLTACAAALMTVFVIRQRTVRSPLLSLDLFDVPVFRSSAVVALVYGAGLFGSTYLLPLFMLVALGYSPSSVGTVLLPAGIALACTIPVAGRLADHQPVARAITVGPDADGGVLRGHAGHRLAQQHRRVDVAGRGRAHRPRPGHPVPQPGRHAIATAHTDRRWRRHDELPASARWCHRGQSGGHRPGVALAHARCRGRCHLACVP